MRERDMRERRDGRESGDRRELWLRESGDVAERGELWLRGERVVAERDGGVEEKKECMYGREHGRGTKIGETRKGVRREWEERMGGENGRREAE